MKRCILISPLARTVSEVYIANGLEGMYYALENTDPAFSGMVECVNLGQRDVRGVDAWIDEESNLSDGRPVFSFGGKIFFAGAVLILDNDGEGETISTELTVARVESMIDWTDLETTGDFGEPREYITDHPLLGPNTSVYEGGKPIYRERA